jgi:hypothetical protein
MENTDMPAVKEEAEDCHQAFDRLTRNREMQKVHDFLLSNSTEDERKFYSDVGAYPTPGGI